MLAAITTPAPELEAALDELAADAGRPLGRERRRPAHAARERRACCRARPAGRLPPGRARRALVDTVDGAGGLASWQVGTPREAREAEDAGCDLVVAPGLDAAGYSRGRAGTMALLQHVLEAVSVPVLAAGGGTARGVAADLAAGAAGVRAGTRFVAATEAGADPRYVEALVAANAEDTLIADRFAPPGVPLRARALRAAIEIGELFYAGESAGAVSVPNPRRRSFASSRRVRSGCWWRARGWSSRQPAHCRRPRRSRRARLAEPHVARQNVPMVDFVASAGLAYHALRGTPPASARGRPSSRVRVKCDEGRRGSRRAQALAFDLQALLVGHVP